MVSEHVFQDFLSTRTIRLFVGIFSQSDWGPFYSHSRRQVRAATSTGTGVCYWVVILKVSNRLRVRSSLVKRGAANCILAHIARAAGTLFLNIDNQKGASKNLSAEIMAISQPMQEAPP